MLNSERMRRQFLGDVCVERVLPERPLSVGEREGRETIVRERERGEAEDALYIPFRGAE